MAGRRLTHCRHCRKVAAASAQDCISQMAVTINALTVISHTAIRCASTRPTYMLITNSCILSPVDSQSQKVPKHDFKHLQSLEQDAACISLRRHEFLLMLALGGTVVKLQAIKDAPIIFQCFHMLYSNSSNMTLSTKWHSGQFRRS